MSYEKQTFVDWELDENGNVVKEGTNLSAEHLIHIEEGIVANEKELENKQPKGNYLTEHQKIKTINGESIVGDGDIHINTGGMSAEQIVALNNLFKKCAFTEDIVAEYAAFRAVFGIPGDPDVPVDPDEPEEPDDPEKILSSISATYSGAEIIVGTKVSDLVGIIVTAHYSDGTSDVVTGFVLSGETTEIAEGSNTITVKYGGKTTTVVITGVSSGASANIVQSLASGKNHLKTNSDATIFAWEYDTSGTMYKAYSYALTAGITYRITGHGKSGSYPYPPFVVVKSSAWDGTFTNEKSTLFKVEDVIHVEPAGASTGTVTADYTATEDCMLYVLDSVNNPVAWVMY